MTNAAKTRPFGSLGWGGGIIISLAAVFVVSTIASTSTERPAAAPAVETRTETAPLVGRALAAIAQPSIALGRYASSGQSQDLRTFAAALSLLQARVQDVARAYPAAGPERDGLTRVDQQLTRSLSLARQVMSQPGAGLLAGAGSPGSVDEVSAEALSSAGVLLESLLRVAVAAPSTLSPIVAEASPRLTIWYASWGIALTLLVAMFLVTAIRRDDDSEQLSPLAAPQPIARAAEPARKTQTTPRSTFSSVASQLEAARLDAPTGLLNRVALAPLITKSIEQSLQKGLTIGLIYVEIDGFREIKEACGPQATNILLHEAARNIKETFRRNDYVARLRDAEFAIMVNEISGRDILTRLELRIHEAIADMHLPELKGRDMKVNIGLAMYPIDGYSDEDLITAARNAVLYRNGAPAFEEAGVQHSTPAIKTEPAREAPKAPEPEVPQIEAVEAQAEQSLQELHALIGSYLAAAKGSPEKQAHAHVLIGEFKKRA